MQDFLIQRIESTVYLLKVYAADKEAALIKAQVGPIERVAEKEGVELLRTTAGLSDTKVVNLVRFQIQHLAQPENSMFDVSVSSYIDDQNRMIDSPYIHEAQAESAAAFIQSVRDTWGKDNIRVVEIPF